MGPLNASDSDSVTRGDGPQARGWTSPWQGTGSHRQEQRGCGRPPVTVIRSAKASQLEKGVRKVWGGLPKDAEYSTPWAKCRGGRVGSGGSTAAIDASTAHWATA